MSNTTAIAQRLRTMATSKPAILGMVVGQKLRGGMSEAKFRRVFFITLLALSFYIVARAFL